MSDFRKDYHEKKIKEMILCNNIHEQKAVTAV